MRGTGISETRRSLSELMADLDPKELRRSLKNTLTAEATRLKKSAGEKVKASGWHKAGDLAKKIRSGACRDLQGYYVAARNYGEKSMHETRRSKKEKKRDPNGKRLKPVTYWLNVGTDNHGVRHKRKSGASTGSTKGIRFIEATEREQKGASIDRLGKEYEKQVKKQIEKRFKRK